MKGYSLTPQSPELPFANVIHEFLVLWGHSLPVASKVLNGLQHKTKFAVLLGSVIETSVSYIPIELPVPLWSWGLSLCACIFSPSLLGALLMWVTLTELFSRPLMPISLLQWHTIPLILSLHLFGFQSISHRMWPCGLFVCLVHVLNQIQSTEVMNKTE